MEALTEIEYLSVTANVYQIRVNIVYIRVFCVIVNYEQGALTVIVNFK